VTDDPDGDGSTPADGGSVEESEVTDVEQGSTGLPESLPEQDESIDGDPSGESIDSDEIARLSSRRTSSGWSPSWYTNEGYLRTQAASGNGTASEGDSGVAGVAQVESVEPEPEVRDSTGTETPIEPSEGDEIISGGVQDASPDVDGVGDGEGGPVEDEDEVEPRLGTPVYSGPYISFRNRGNPLG